MANGGSGCDIVENMLKFSAQRRDFWRRFIYLLEKQTKRKAILILDFINIFQLTIKEASLFSDFLSHLEQGI